MTVEAIENQASDAANEAAEQAAANAAFAATRGVEATPVVEKSAEEVEAERQAQAEADSKAMEVQWLEGVPQSVRERLERIPKLESTANQIGTYARRLKAAEDRIEAMTLAATDAAKAATNAGDDAPTSAQISAASSNSEKWKQIKEDFPEWAEAMDERLSGMRGGSVDVESITKQVQDSFTPTLTEMREESRQMARIDAAHDGWEDTVKTPEFTDWFKAQPEELQALSLSTKAKDAIALLDAFKEANPSSVAAPPASRNDPKARLAAAVTPTKASAVPVRENITEEEAAAAAFKRVRGG